MRRIKLVIVVAITVTVVCITAAGSASAELGLLPNTTFTGKGAAGVLLMLSKGELACKANTMALGVESTTEKDKHGEFIVKFEGCTAFGLAVNSLGDASAVLLSPMLWLLCFTNKAKLEMGVLVKLDNDIHVEIPSLKQLFAIKGSAVGTIVPDAKKAVAFTMEFRQSGGAQEVTECEGNGAKEKLEVELESKAPEAAAFLQKEGIAADKETEIMEA